MNINYQVHKDILEHLREISRNSENEVCGFVIENGNKFIQCENIHPEPKNYFLISPKDYIWERDTILFHSHPAHGDVIGFSDWDVQNQFYFQLKMLLYSVKYDEFYFKDP